MTRTLTCGASALVISVTFQLLHQTYLPYKSAACNQIQSICLSIMSLVYFLGVLLVLILVVVGNWFSLNLFLAIFESKGVGKDEDDIDHQERHEK